MKLSIIVPVYNVEKYLDECLDSLINQTLKEEYEIIAVNDGSTDGSLEILERRAAENPDKLRFISVENGGQGRARNLGLEMACGEFIGFVDSDDWVDATMFEKLIAAAEAEEADVVCCRCYECRTSGMTLSAENSSRKQEDFSAVWDKVYRRKLLKDIHFPEGLWYEDVAYASEAVSTANKIAFVEEGLYFYRIGQASTMTNKNALKNLDIIPIMETVREFYLSHGLDMNSFEYHVLNHVLVEAIKRVAAMRVGDGKKVIRKLRTYAKSRIPKLNACEEYKKMAAGRRLAIWMNYHGLEDISVIVLKLKSSL